jgi:hypothetical protein
MWLKSAPGRGASFGFQIPHRTTARLSEQGDAKDNEQ